MRRLFEMTIVREAPCAAAVGIWNYWDMEHPPFVHKGFERYDILHESEHLFLVLVKLRLPIFRFLSYTSIHCAVRKKENIFAAYSRFFGAPSVTTYTITEPKPDISRYEMHYRIDLKGWRVILHPILKVIIPIHNERVWTEDFALKTRRQKVLRLNFKDFIGLPERIQNRTYAGPIVCKIPIPRPPGCSVDSSPLR